MNHEYTTAQKGAYTWLFGPNGTEPWTADKARKAMNAHGVSVIHIERNKAGKWAIVPDSRYNRRITASTPMDLHGSAAGSHLLKTQAAPRGTQVLGPFTN